MLRGRGARNRSGDDFGAAQLEMSFLENAEINRIRDIRCQLRRTINFRPGPESWKNSAFADLAQATRVGT